MRQLALLVLCAVTVGGCASGTVKQRAGKPVSLFNGKDLTGWVGFFGDTGAKMEDVFTVKDGAIHCIGKPKGYIRTSQKYTNFILRLKWRFIQAGNTGVLVRVQDPDKLWPKAVEAQLNSGNAGDIIAMDFPLKGAADRTKGRRTEKANPSNEKPIGQWNEYEITVDGDKLTLKVNGLIQNKAKDLAVIPGYILLQSEGSVVEFKDIALKPLSVASEK